MALTGMGSSFVHWGPLLSKNFCVDWVHAGIIEPEVQGSRIFNYFLHVAVINPTTMSVRITNSYLILWKSYKSTIIQGYGPVLIMGASLH